MEYHRNTNKTIAPQLKHAEYKYSFNKWFASFIWINIYCFLLSNDNNYNKSLKVQLRKNISDVS